MPDEQQQSKEEVASAASLERRLRGIKRHITGVSAIDPLTLPDAEADIFEARLTTAKEYWKSFLSLWEQREELGERLGAAHKFPNDQWFQLYDALQEEIIKASGALLTIRKIEASRKAGANVNATLNETGILSTKPQLPRISIPMFSGDILKWTHFRDTFQSLIHHEPSLSNIEKFHYLIGALKGEAAILLSTFPVEDKSYEQAWKKVIDTYNNPRVLASVLVNRMIDCDTKSIKGELQRYDAFLIGIADNIEAFKALKLKDSAEFLLATLALRALDVETRRHFELSLTSSQELPTADSVISFVRQRKTALRMSQGIEISPDHSSFSHKPSHSRNSKSSYNSVSLVAAENSNPNQGKKGEATVAHLSKSSQQRSNSKETPPGNQNLQCLHCKEGHILSQCKPFQALPPLKRIELVKSWKVCFNCLRKGHGLYTCRSNYRCRTCNKRHHSFIHGIHDRNTESRKNIPQQPIAESFTGFGSTPTALPTTNTMVLLGTVRTLVRSRRGGFHLARALLDPGSQHTFMTTTLSRKIGVQLTPFAGTITGLSELAVPSSNLKGSAECIIRPCAGSIELMTTAVVVDRITSTLPNRNLPSSLIDKLMDNELADHQFGESGPIDLLIGGDICPQIGTGASRETDVQSLYLQPTIFGLVVTGVVNLEAPSTSCSLVTLSERNIEFQLNKFWEVEEPKPADRTHPDDLKCEEHFQKTHMRESDGRYVVRLPFKKDVDMLGDNKNTALRRFYSLESRLKKDLVLSENYKCFMKEYRDLGHMTPTSTKVSYLIPHHGVWQERPQGRKLRVVFDASCPSSTLCLNDLLLAGPSLQGDLCDILIRFRLFTIAICADLVKMYRQILVHPEDRHYQHILWRDDISKALEEFELNTVTYGIKSSPFLALRVLRQLVLDEGSSYPLASVRILNDMYVDDLVTGADTPEEAHALICELRELFSKGGFALSKWASSRADLLPGSSKHVQEVSIHNQGQELNVKVLGIFWNSTSDSFLYTARQPPLVNITKRVMLSTIARMFDPLGLLAPVIFLAKSLIQEVWKAKLGWDDELSPEMLVEWKSIVSDWQTLSSISIPRYITSRGAKHTLIGFCDASKRGYAAALYLRSEDSSGNITISLVKAKSKVAPVKFHSISRLELCGALLLSRLVSSSPSQLTTHGMVCFTDSKVVLDWLKTPVYSLPVFEANRVSQILSVVPLNNWQHVSSEDNPADISSRGCTPSKLKTNRLWWSGPSWLQQQDAKWLPSSSIPTTSLFTSNKDQDDDWTTRFSSFTKLVRTVAIMVRFINKLKPCLTTPHPLPTGPITAQEIFDAEMRVCRYVQRLYFPDGLFNDVPTIPGSLLQLSPFLDELGVIRVGGRLQHSSLEYSTKHPILVPRQSHLARLLINHTHVSHYHAGPSLTLALLRNRYWIPSVRGVIRGLIHRCVKCRIDRAKPIAPLMAPLPKERFAQNRAFVHVGVDYAGPFLIKESKRRNAAPGKAYLCLFICFSCKALHLELVSSLTASAFLAALDRFISRRGKPTTIWSDHGTNFVGASRHLKEMYRFIEEMKDHIVQNLATQHIEWKFIPPRAPHFGGLWEAGVKSVKNLLTNTIGKQLHTFEELATTLTKIEALLNSRPLCPLTDNGDDYNFLTPGHFLIGEPLTSLPEKSEISSLPLMSRWKMLQAHIAHVWERWRREYLHTLQQRTKWQKKTQELKIGDLVILIERRSVVGNWPVGRVIQTFPGRDGLIRTVSVMTPSGNCLTRAVTSLVPLFYPEHDETMVA